MTDDGGMTLQPEDSGRSQTDAAPKLWTSLQHQETFYRKCENLETERELSPLLGIPAAGPSCGEVQSWVKSLLWTTHGRIGRAHGTSPAGFVSPDPGLTALTTAAPVPNTNSLPLKASGGFQWVPCSSGCQAIRALVQATWGNFKHPLGFSGFWELDNC